MATVYSGRKARWKDADEKSRGGIMSRNKSEKRRQKREERKKMKRDGKENYLRRSGRTNKHHLVPKSLGGTRDEDNLFTWDSRRHNAYHLLFNLKTFPEAARLLMRAWNMKKKTNEVLEEEYIGGGNS